MTTGDGRTGARTEPGTTPEEATGAPRGTMSRRAVLSGLGTVGAIGALGGLGTSAVVLDRERTGAFLRSGVLDLELCWEAGDIDAECDPVSDNEVSLPIAVAEEGDGGSATLRCGLAETGESNPGYLWFRTGCGADACGLESAVSVTLWYDRNCNGVRDEDEPVIERGRLCDVVSELHGGRLLDGNLESRGTDPLDPGENCCLGFSWELEEPVCEPDELTVDFQFRLEQARHAMELTNPWEGATCDVDCDEECPGCLDLAGMSFVAFCSRDRLRQRDVSFRVTARNPDGEVTELEWESSKRITRVVVKLGNGAVRDGGGPRIRVPGGGFAMYEFPYPGDIGWLPDGGSRGTVRSEDGRLVVDGEPWDPCDGDRGLKYEFDERRWERV